MLYYLFRVCIYSFIKYPYFIGIYGPPNVSIKYWLNEKLIVIYLNIFSLFICVNLPLYSYLHIKGHIIVENDKYYVTPRSYIWMYLNVILSVSKKGEFSTSDDYPYRNTLVYFENFYNYILENYFLPKSSHS